VSAALEVRGLTRSFGPRKILSDVSFQLKHGEILIIMGGSGCGKSTLLRHIIGSLKPDAGEIYIHGTEITKLDDEGMSKMRKRFGMLFQTGALFNSLTVGENVALPILESSDVSPNIAELVVKLKLELVGLTGFERARPAQPAGVRGHRSKIVGNTGKVSRSVTTAGRAMIGRADGRASARISLTGLAVTKKTNGRAPGGHLPSGAHPGRPAPLADAPGHRDRIVRRNLAKASHRAAKFGAALGLDFIAPLFLAL